MFSPDIHPQHSEEQAGLPSFDSSVHVDFEGPAFFQFVLTESDTGAVEMHCRKARLGGIAHDIFEEAANGTIESAKLTLQGLHFDGGISGFETSTQDMIEVPGKPIAVGFGFHMDGDLIVAPAKETIDCAENYERWEKFKHLVPDNGEPYTLDVPLLALCATRAGYTLHVENEPSR